VEEDIGLSVGAAWIAGQDRSMWRTLRPSAGQAPLCLSSASVSLDLKALYKSVIIIIIIIISSE